jgi:regulatory protein
MDAGVSPGTATGDPLEAVREAALGLLSSREHSRRDLVRKLRRKGHSQDHIETIVGRLEAAGLVSDERYARLFVTDRLAIHPLGRRRIVMELRRRGIGAEAAARAVDEVYQEGEVDERVVAERLARRRAIRLQDVDPAAARRRLAGYLARRGFAPEIVAEAVQRASGHPREVDETPDERVSARSAGSPSTNFSG